MKRAIRNIFDRLDRAVGPRGWWPGQTRDEIIIGAVLTQNTAWRNVERAIASLKGRDLLSLAKLARRAPERIAPLIVPAGYFNLKARRLRAVAGFFAPGGRERFDEFEAWPMERLRDELLGVWGVGPETADSILLYALDRLTFVVDAYTIRIASRHGLCGEKATYEETRRLFSDAVPSELQSFNEAHAQLVWVGHHFCKPKPRCGECPLSRRDCYATGEAWARMAPARRDGRTAE